MRFGPAAAAGGVLVGAVTQGVRVSVTEAGVTAGSLGSQLKQQRRQLFREDRVVGAVRDAQHSRRLTQPPRGQRVLEPVQSDLAYLQVEDARQRTVRPVVGPAGGGT